MGIEVDLDTAVGSGDPAATGMAGGAELLAFAEAAVKGASLGGLRRALIAAVGMDGAVQAAATVAAFSGLVRVADGTGIPIDDGLASASTEIRGQLDLDSFAGAGNSDLRAVVAGGANDPISLFGGASS